MKKRYKYVLATALSLTLGGYMINQTLSSVGSIKKERLEQSPQHNGKKFQNPVAVSTVKGKDTFALFKAYIFDKKKPAMPKNPIEVLDITAEQLAALPSDESYFFRLGHSSLLIWLEGEFWLTDPVFSERASPVQFMGPKRFHQPPISIENLPQIKGVILSHNHYDHLDKAAVKALNDKVEHFYMPLGMGGDLAKWGVDENKISEFDWWQNVQVGSVQLTATPSQHFSGRSLTDGNKTLWASWAIKGKQHSYFFSGDSGYFDGFKEIGNKLGPFDVGFIETGAYNPLWADIHMQPSESVQATQDIKAALMVPIHNGTFDLSLHTWTDPFEQVEKLAKANDLKWLTPQMGEAVRIGQEYELNRWWDQ